MKLLIAGFFALSSAAFAASIAPVSYHEGTLVSFTQQTSASNCSSKSEPACSDDDQMLYVVKSEGIVYTLIPVGTATGSIAEKATLGWSKTLSKTSSLYHQQPGTPLQLRDDGKHLFVKVGNRESRYTTVEAP
jgi:hypothetical protein